LLLEQRKTTKELITKNIEACETGKKRSPAFFRAILSSKVRLDE
jgi:hypothetical protein